MRHARAYAAFRSVTGSQLRGLARDQCLINGRPWSVPTDGTLEMQFDECTVLLSCADDGESVGAAVGELDIPPPLALDNGATWKCERVDLGRDPGFGRLIGRAVVRVEAVVDVHAEPARAEVVSAWVVRFAGGDFVAYQNAVDGSRILINRLPPHPDPTVRTRRDVVAG